MRRVCRRIVAIILAAVSACALTAWGADEAGRRAANAGLHDWRAPIHIASPDAPPHAGEFHSRRRPAADCGLLRVATAGPPPEAIREAQELLARLGYAPGPANGVWGQSTMRAYQEFLRDLGRPVSDTLTRPALRTMRRLAERRGGVAASPRQAPPREKAKKQASQRLEEARQQVSQSRHDRCLQKGGSWWTGEWDPADWPCWELLDGDPRVYSCWVEKPNCN